MEEGRNATLQPLLLVRHGEADHLIQSITGGWSDTDLTPKGEEQAAHLGKRLRGELDGRPLTLVSSDLKRAWQTANILGAHLGLTPQVLPALRDLNNGIAAGKTHAEARQHARPPSDPYIDWQPYPGAETWRQFFQRVVAFMDEFAPAQTGPTILVTHAAVIHVIIAWWLQLGIESQTDFVTDPAGLTVLMINRWNERTIERLNDTAHLFEGGIGSPVLTL